MPRKLDKEAVLNSEFFQEDLVAFDDQIKKTEGLYDEVHDVYGQMTGGDGANFKMMRDISEVAKTLSAIRATSVDAINKRFQAKKSIAEFEQKKGKDDQDNSNVQEIARAMVMALREAPPAQKTVTQATDKSKEMLDKRIKTDIKDKKIHINDNESIMGEIYKGVEVIYKSSAKRFMAYSKEGKLIENYPQSRIPNTQITKEEDGFIFTADGMKYRVL